METQEEKKRYIGEIIYIRSKLTRPEKYMQLSEEASEVAQAALKNIRATCVTNNPTPKTPEQAEKELQNEMLDIMTAYYVIYGRVITEEDILTYWKNGRWAARIKEQCGGPLGEL